MAGAGVRARDGRETLGDLAVLVLHRSGGVGIGKIRLNCCETLFERRRRRLGFLFFGLRSSRGRRGGVLRVQGRCSERAERDDGRDGEAGDDLGQFHSCVWDVGLFVDVCSASPSVEKRSQGAALVRWLGQPVGSAPLATRVPTHANDPIQQGKIVQRPRFSARAWLAKNVHPPQLCANRYTSPGRKCERMLLARIPRGPTHQNSAGERRQLPGGACGSRAPLGRFRSPLAKF